jgi:hypothetical protein
VPSLLLDRLGLLANLDRAIDPLGRLIHAAIHRLRRLDRLGRPRANLVCNDVRFAPPPPSAAGAATGAALPLGGRLEARSFGLLLF